MTSDPSDDDGLSPAQWDFVFYFDHDNNRPFDDEARALIDRIAYDPRYSRGSGAHIVAGDFTSHLHPDRRRTIERAAAVVYNNKVGNALHDEAEQLLAKALLDPEFDLEAVLRGRPPG